MRLVSYRIFRRVHGKHDRAGFTLTEIMVASVIFLMVSIGFSSGLISALKTQHTAAFHYRAMSLARNRIQRAKTLEFWSLPLMVESLRRVDDEGNLSASGSYYRTTTVTLVAPNCVEIIAQVYFTKVGGGMSEQPVTVQTMIAEGM